MSEKIITIPDIIRQVNNVSYKEDIVVFDSNLNMGSPIGSPLRFDSLLIMLVTQGECTLTIDLREFTVRRNSLIVTQPKNYISVSSQSADCRVRVCVCSRYIVEEVLPVLTDILPLLLHHRIEPVRQLSDSDAEGMDLFYNFLKKKLCAPPTPFLRQKMLCILQGALFELLDIHASELDRRPAPKSRKDEIMAKFIVAVSENFRQNRQVSFYAEKLCITPKHLSAVVKEKSGRTAGDWIENYVGMEAKVLLKSTDLTIQEIAMRLNFANQSFFGKYFKHLTGMSPTDYRKNLQSNA